MEEFLPSEIARAVYGYLISEGCEDAASSFLQTSPNLVECKQRVKHGKPLTHANTLLLGKSLVEVLNIACSVHSVVKQIYLKQQKGKATNHESLTELLDQLRTCVFSNTRIEENSCSEALSHLESQGLLCSPHHLRTPPSKAMSLAETYRSLVQECSEGLDLSMSPEKTSQKNKNVESPCCKQSANRQQTANVLGALELSQLDMDNDSAVAAITGMGITPIASVAPKVPQMVTALTSSLPVLTSTLVTTPLSCAVSNITASSTEVMTTAVSTVMTTHQQPSTTQNNHMITAGSLPDPPIIVWNGPNQSFEGGVSAAYFNMLPCAASTPEQRPLFMPEDTAFILYPPLSSVPKAKQKKVPLKEKTNLRRSGRLRKLLPKPPRQDPPHIIHLKVLPQEVDEEAEEDIDEPNEMVLAKKLPTPEEKIISDDEGDGCVEKESEIEVVKSEVAVATTSDKENISDENISKGDSGEKSNKMTSECDKEISTPRPPKLRKNISRSTPRRNSHVRALSFNTPLKSSKSRKSNTSPKIPKIKFSPRSDKLSCVKRSSLFSPKNDKDLSLVNEEVAGANHAGDDPEEIEKEKTQNFLDDSQLCKIPIATRGPAPKLSSAWQEVNDVKIAEKPVWDEKIRNFALGDFEDPAPPPKKRPKDKQAQIDLSPTKNNTILNNHSSSADGKKECKRKSSKFKKESFTPVESDPIEYSSSNIIKENATNKVNKTRDTILDSCQKSSNTENIVSQKCPNSVTDAQINVDDKNNKDVEVFTEVQDKAIENQNIENNNILLEDLVVSSNSCFTMSNDEVRYGSNNEQVTSCSKNSNETIVVDQNNQVACSKSLSPVFVQSNVVVLETPLKEFQVCDQKMFDLTTPLVKSIRQETSVLEQDLLLTPSLPPTPQLNSSPKNYTKTPCKTAIKSQSIHTKQQASDSLQNESKLTENDKTESIPSTNLDNIKERGNISSNVNESEIEDDHYSPSPVQTQQIIQNRNGSENIHSRTVVSTSTDTSECENNSQEMCFDTLLPKSKINSCKNVKKNNVCRTRNYIYSTSESSDDETNTKIEINNSPKKTKLSKLASVLLEKERKSLNKTSRKSEAKKKVKILNSNPPQQSPESGCSVNFTQSTDGVTTSTRNKNGKESIAGSKKSKDMKNKSPKTSVNRNEALVKQSAPENIRQQLQSDLLERERKIIFGDRIPSTSDSDSDTDIFEKKTTVSTKTKFQKGVKKKKKPVHTNISLLEDSSDECVNQINFNSPKTKTVKFNIVRSNPLRSPNNTVDLNLLLSNNKNTPIKSVDNSRGNVNPSTESSEPLTNRIKENFQQCNKVPQLEIPIIHLDCDLIHDSNSKHTSNCNMHNKVMDMSSKNSEDNISQNQSFKQCGSEMKMSFKDINPNKHSTDVHTKLIDSSSKEIDFSGNDTDSVINKRDESNTIIIENSNSLGQNNHSSPKPPSSEILYSMEDMERESLQTNCNEGENEICITSTSEKISVTSMSDQLDLERQETFQVDEGNVVLSYSQIIEHYFYSPLDLDRLVQGESTELIQKYTNKDTNDGVEKVMTKKDQSVKRRIKLIPIEDDKYEQKLQVDYDVIDSDNVIVNRGNRRLSCDIDILDCSTSSLLSSDTGYLNKQNYNMPQNLKNSQENKKDSVYEHKDQQLDAGILSKTEELTGEGKTKEKVECSNPKYIKNKLSVPTQEKHKKNSGSCINYDGNKEKVCRTTIKDVSKLKNQKRHYDRERSGKEYIYEIVERNKSRYEKELQSPSERRREQDDLNEIKRNKSRHEKELPSPSERRRDRDEDGRYDRPYNSRDRRRYSERRRRESDRRGFSERRNHSSHKYNRRGSSPGPEANRYNPKKYCKIPAVIDSETIEQLKKSLSKIEEHDLDRVHKKEESEIERLHKEEKVDPRAAHVLTYSDVEKNDSSRDEADSLMDFAVVTKTKNISVTPENLRKIPSVSSSNLRQDPTQSNKRKATNEIRETPDSGHVEKKLKLGEVEMKEAKSVLRHKMVDMLNVLHPDTSNEAT